MAESPPHPHPEDQDMMMVHDEAHDMLGDLPFNGGEGAVGPDLRWAVLCCTAHGSRQRQPPWSS
jgi:hypothetical protein